MKSVIMLLLVSPIFVSSSEKSLLDRVGEVSVVYRQGESQGIEPGAPLLTSTAR